MWCRPATLRGRLALSYAAIVCGVLLAFAGTIYLVIAAAEANEPPALAALEGPDATGSQVLLALGVTLPVALAIAIGSALWIARRTLSGLEAIVEIAGQLSAGNLSQRIPERPHEARELRQLTTALNGMLQRLDLSVSGMRRFTEDASHELRTPLSRLLGDVELVLRRPRDAQRDAAALESTMDELALMSRLVDSLLTLARSDAGALSLQPVPVDAAVIARQAMEPYELVASEKGVTIALTISGPAPVCGDPLWLGRAITNLVDNAVKLTPAGGAVEILLEAGAELITIAVRDSGPGVREEDRARLFERFYRSSTLRGTTEGFGLGLALSRDIARASGGDLVFVAREGGGAEFSLSLPRERTLASWTSTPSAASTRPRRR